MSKLSKTLEYRRARWLEDGQNLEQLARTAWGRFVTQKDRTISRNDQISISGLTAHDFENHGFAVHCASYIEGQGVGTIPMVPAENAEVGERQPEQDENFLSFDFMALLKGNHVIALNCGRNAGRLRSFLEELFRSAKFEDATTQFDLVRIGSPDKIAMIKAVGVKTIDMKVDISDASASALIDGSESGGIWRTATQHIYDAFRAITESDQEFSRLRAAERGSVTVSINVKKGDLDTAQTGLDELAKAIANDDEADDFVIQLRNSQAIKASEVVVRRQVKLDAAANSVSVPQAWDAMISYLVELTDNGQIAA